MGYAPCKNPSCSSYGKPHPNCQCYGGMAEGGEVGNYCAANKAHQKGCKYFAEGGNVNKFSVPKGYEEVKNPDESEQNSQFSIPEGYEEVKTPDTEPAEAKLDLPEGYEEKSKIYSTPMQQLQTAGEGLVQGVPLLGPLATSAEIGLSKLGVPNVSAEDIAARGEANPLTHDISKAAGFLGSLVATRGGSVATGIGAAALKGAVSNIMAQGSDEATNWLLNQQDPEKPVASALTNMGYAGLMGLVGGGIGYKVGDKLAALANKNVGSEISPFLEGVAAAANGMKINPISEEVGIASKLAGQQYYNNLISHISNIGGGVVGSIEGAREGYNHYGVAGLIGGGAAGGLSGSLAGLFGKPFIDKLSSVIGKTAVAPFLNKIVSSGSAQGLGQAINYATDVSRGYSKMQKAVDALFTGGPAISQQIMSDQSTKDNRDRLKQYLDDGGIEQNFQETISNQNQQPQGFADGGEVFEPKKDKEKKNIQPLIQDDDGMAIHFPNQNMVLNNAKYRISSYLKSIQPIKNAPKLPFDDDLKDPQKEKSFNRALDIANNPLSVLHEVHKGTIGPEDITHFQAMYPEINNVLAKKITDKITDAQINNKKPPFHIRQGLSLLLGTPLSSDVTPGNIQAAQATFLKPQGPDGQGQQLPKSIKGSSALNKLGSRAMTPNQARAERAQSEKI